MKKISKVLVIMFLSILLLNSVMLDSVHAATTGKLENVLVKLKGNVVAINLSDFKEALKYKEKDTLYNFLIQENNSIEVHGVASGDKYITLKEYKEILRYDANGIVADALDLSKPIPASEVAEFMEVGNVNEETGVVELVPIEAPGIEAKFKAFAYLDTNGHVVVTVYNVPDAMQYNVVYKYPDGREGVTTKVLIGSDKGAGPIYYNETITVNIFDANDKLVHTFKDVKLLKDVKTYTNEINNYINNYLE